MIIDSSEYRVDFSTVRLGSQFSCRISIELKGQGWIAARAGGGNNHFDAVTNSIMRAFGLPAETEIKRDNQKIQVTCFDKEASLGCDAGRDWIIPTVEVCHRMANELDLNLKMAATNAIVMA